MFVRIWLSRIVCKRFSIHILRIHEKKLQKRNNWVFIMRYCRFANTSMVLRYCEFLIKWTVYNIILEETCHVSLTPKHSNKNWETEKRARSSRSKTKYKTWKAQRKIIAPSFFVASVSDLIRLYRYRWSGEAVHTPCSFKFYFACLLILNSKTYSAGGLCATSFMCSIHTYNVFL